MTRRVVTEGTPRCERCRFAPRWCICEGFRALELPLRIDVLIHHREFWRPTSTGRLINRVIPASHGHVFRHDLPLNQAAIVLPDRELWILHPKGEVLPEGRPPGNVQILLLDGSWREAARMLQGVERWGRAISLPMTGPGRYLLRDQPAAGHYSTVEALLFLLGRLGFEAEQEQLRLQFELHVYAEIGRAHV